MTRTRVSHAVRLARHWLAPVADPVNAARGLIGYWQYVKDWRSYQALPGAEPITFVDSFPQVHDRTSTSTIDPHYFYINNWAMRRVIAIAPALHIDIGSQTIFASLLASTVNTVFVDYRPLHVTLSGMHSLGGDLLGLPFADGALASLSCLHVIEHVGLGRYGDPLDPSGTYRAVRELVRVLAPGGSLLLATPVGRPRLCFNAHRIHVAEDIRAMAPELELREFSGIDDNGTLHEGVELSAFKDCEYACGFFWLRRPVGL